MAVDGVCPALLIDPSHRLRHKGRRRWVLSSEGPGPGNDGVRVGPLCHGSVKLQPGGFLRVVAIPSRVNRPKFLEKVTSRRVCVSRHRGGLSFFRGFGGLFFARGGNVTVA